jgi:hypothetical protein
MVALVWQAIFGVNSDRYFLDLYLQFAHRPPPTGAPYLASCVHSDHARRLGSNSFASKDKNTHLVRNLGGKGLQMNTSSCTFARRQPSICMFDAIHCLGVTASISFAMVRTIVIALL